MKYMMVGFDRGEMEQCIVGHEGIYYWGDYWKKSERKKILDTGEDIIAVVVVTPPEIVGIERILEWEPIDPDEGFMDIIYVNWEENEVDDFLDAADRFEQHSIWHKETLGEHCRRVGEALEGDLKIAGLLHDVGKITYWQVDGETWHYNKHDIVGSYMCLLYHVNVDKTWLSNVIYGHMGREVNSIYDKDIKKLKEADENGKTACVYNEG